MTRKNQTLNLALAAATAVSLGAFAANATLSAPAAPAVQEPVDPVQNKEVRGKISSVGTDDSFVITDSMNETHAVSTNEKTTYTVDGKDAIRDEVIVKNADVVAKVNEEGVAVSVDRTTK